GAVREPPVARHANVGLEHAQRITGVLLQTRACFIYCVRGVAVDVHLSRTDDQHQSDRHRHEELDERQAGGPAGNTCRAVIAKQLALHGINSWAPGSAAGTATAVARSFRPSCRSWCTSEAFLQ